MTKASLPSPVKIHGRTYLIFLYIVGEIIYLRQAKETLRQWQNLGRNKPNCRFSSFWNRS
jgi:hypothetical protein